MLSLTLIHDSDVLWDRYALISQAARHNSHILYDSNATLGQITGDSTLCEHHPHSR